MKWFVAAFAVSLATSVPAFAHRVIGVTTGDTLTLLVNQQPLTVRLANIDAPEKMQAFAEQSRQSLAALCMGREADYKEQDIDYRGQTVAAVTCDGVEASRAQIERGMAWVDDKHNRDFTFPALQWMARRDRKGLWAHENPVPPWEFRRPKTRKVNPLPSNDKTDPAICFVDRRGEYRTVDGAKRYGC